jgi:hypothetical protein
MEGGVVGIERIKREYLVESEIRLVDESALGLLNASCR